MQTIRVFNAFDETLKLDLADLDQWAIEAFNHLRAHDGGRGDLLREVAHNVTDQQVFEFIFLAGIQHFLGGHDDACALRYAGQALQERAAYSPFVMTVQETLQTQDEDYTLEPTSTTDDFIMHIYEIAPPEVKADWDSSLAQRSIQKLRQKFEERRADMVESFEIVEREGTSFEQRMNWQTVEIENIKPRKSGFSDLLSDLLGNIFGGLD